MLNNIAGVLAPFVAAPTSSYESIATVDVGSGGSSTITFSSIPSTFKHLQIRSLSHSSTGAQPAMILRLNSDSGANYSWHGLEGNGAGSAYAYSFGTANTGSYIYSVAGTAFNASAFSGHVIDVLDYQNTNKYKTIRSLGGNDNNGNGYVSFNSGSWRSTSAVTGITITIDGGGNFTQYSSFALYGIKG